MNRQWQYLTEALAVLWSNRTRTALTLAGLVIGVMAVITIQILGAGMAGAVGGTLDSVNDRSFTIFPNARQADFTRAALSVSDIERARIAVPDLVAALPLGSVTREARLGAGHAKLRIAGESEQHFVTSPVRFGRTIDAADVRDAAPVCVLLESAYAKLGISGDPVGSTLRAGDRRYTIVGVLRKELTGIIPSVVSYDVLVPSTTYERDDVRGGVVLGGRFLVGDPTRLEADETATLAYLARLKGGRTLYQSIDRKTLSTAVDGIFAGLTLIVGLIGSVSLVVAGIGILNIMLVSVAERTREIGLRKAIGATSSQVLAQFFIEALLLSAIGCGLGLVLGLALGAAVDTFALVAISGIVAPIPWVRAAVTATLFATLVTLLFGTYPAYRASRLDPIAALRYE